MHIVPINQVRPNPITTKLFPIDQSYDQLKLSIELDGVLEPLIVQKDSDDAFVIISGLRRYRASRDLGLETIPVIVRDPQEITEDLIISHQVQRVKTYSEIIREVRSIKQRYHLRQGARSNGSTDLKEGRQRLKAIVDKHGKSTIDRLTKLDNLAWQYAKDNMSKYDEIMERLDRSNSITGTIKHVSEKIKFESNNEHPFTSLEVLDESTHKVYRKSSEKLSELGDESVQCVITSPPYPFKIRDYDLGENQIGHERTIEDFLHKLYPHFKEVYRVLDTKGSFFLNIGDYIDPQKSSYQLVSFHLANELTKIGWKLTDVIIWVKNNPRCTNGKRSQLSHEYIFHFVKSTHYYYDLEWLNKDNRVPSYMTYGSNNGPLRISSCWDFRPPVIFTNSSNNKWLDKMCKEQGLEMNHTATFPKEIPYTLIQCATKPGDIVLDVFNGSGTTGQAAIELNRRYIGYELSPQYFSITKVRLDNTVKAMNSMNLNLQAA